MHHSWFTTAEHAQVPLRPHLPFNNLGKFAILQKEDVSAVDAVKVEGVSIRK